MRAQFKISAGLLLVIVAFWLLPVTLQSRTLVKKSSRSVGLITPLAHPKKGFAAG